MSSDEGEDDGPENEDRDEGEDDDDDNDEHDPEYVSASEEDEEEPGSPLLTEPEKTKVIVASPLPPAPTTSAPTPPQPSLPVSKPVECTRCHLIVPGADGPFMRQFAPKFYNTACSPAFEEQLKQLGISFSPRFLCEVCCEDKLKPMERSSHRRGGQYTIVMARVEQSSIQVRSFLKKGIVTSYHTPSEWHIHQLARLLRYGRDQLDWETAKQKAAKYYKKFYEPMCPPDSTETKGTKIDKIGIPMFHLRSVPLPPVNDKTRIDEYLRCQNGMRRLLQKFFPDRQTLYAPLERQQLIDYLRILKPSTGRKSGNSPTASGTSPASTTSSSSSTSYSSGGRQRNKSGQKALVTPDQDAIMDANWDMPLAQMMQRTYQPKPEELEPYVINIIIPRFFQLKDDCQWTPSLADPVSVHRFDFKLNDFGIPLVKETEPPFTGAMIVEELFREKDSLSHETFGQTFVKGCLQKFIDIVIGSKAP